MRIINPPHTRIEIRESQSSNIQNLSNGNWYTTNSITIPESGYYDVYYRLVGYVSNSTNTTLRTRIYNNTNGQVLSPYDDSNNDIRGASTSSIVGSVTNLALNVFLNKDDIIDFDFETPNNTSRVDIWRRQMVVVSRN